MSGSSGKWRRLADFCRPRSRNLDWSPLRAALAALAHI